MRRLEVPHTLLVLKPSSFGDIIHTLPAVARLKSAWPECRISWLANPEWMPLLKGNRFIVEVIPFPRADFRGWGGGRRMLRWLRSGAIRRGFDLALDFQGLLRTAVAGRMSGARKVVGLSDAREGATWLYHQTVNSPRQPVHATVRYLALANAVISAGGMDSGKHISETVDSLPAGEPLNLPADLAGKFVLLHPYSRGQGKSLDDNTIREFVRKLGSSGTILVGRRDSDIAVQEHGCLNLMNQTNIAQLIWLVRRAAFVVSVDSGPAHLAAALGRPMVAIHSWSDPRRVGPCRPDSWVWKNGRLAQVRDLARMDREFFKPSTLDLRTEDVAAIAALAATSL